MKAERSLDASQCVFPDPELALSYRVWGKVCSIQLCGLLLLIQALSCICSSYLHHTQNLTWSTGRKEVAPGRCFTGDLFLHVTSSSRLFQDCHFRFFLTKCSSSCVLCFAMTGSIPLVLIFNILFSIGALMKLSDKWLCKWVAWWSVAWLSFYKCFAL